MVTLLLVRFFVSVSARLYRPVPPPIARALVKQPYFARPGFSQARVADGWVHAVLGVLSEIAGILWFLAIKHVIQARAEKIPRLASGRFLELA